MYTIKTYSISGTLIKTISPNAVIGDISWSSQINGWQGELRVKMAYPLNQQFEWDIVRVFVTNSDYPQWKCMYTGLITKITYEMWATEYIELTALWLQVLFWFKLHPNGTKSWAVSTILSDTIDYMNTYYSWIFQKEITTVANTTSLNLQDQYVSQVFQLAKLKWYNWIIDWEWKFIWKSDASQVVHRVKLWNELEKATYTTDREMMVNRFFAKWASTTTTSEDLLSISENFLREVREEVTEITDTWALQRYWDSKIQAEKPTMKMTIQKYDIYSIYPGQFIKLLNTSFEMMQVQVFKVTYRKDKADIEFWNITSISEALRT